MLSFLSKVKWRLVAVASFSIYSQIAPVLAGVADLFPELSIEELRGDLKHDDTEVQAKMEEAARTKFEKATKNGFFYLKVPQTISDEEINAVTDFGYDFAKDQVLRSFKLGEWGGYHDREADQVESFYCEKAYWSESFADSENLQNFIRREPLDFKQADPPNFTGAEPPDFMSWEPLNFI